MEYSTISLGFGVFQAYIKNKNFFSECSLQPFVSVFVCFFFILVLSTCLMNLKVLTHSFFFLLFCKVGKGVFICVLRLIFLQMIKVCSMEDMEKRKQV